MKPSHNDDRLMTDEAIRLRHVRDADALARAEQTLEKVKAGDESGPVIEAEELAEFLRERR